VNVRVHTDPAGNVTDTKVESSSSRFFNGLTQKAAQRWKFKPTSEPQEWILRFEFMKTDTTAVAEHVAR
jgi:TonB family protein